MLPNTVSAYSEYAAKEFLQTVVFVDDRIYNRKHGAVAKPQPVLAPKKRKKAVKSADKDVLEKTVASVSNDGGTDDYSPHDIVTSFAKKQIICSLYQPQKNAKVSAASDIFPLCLASDIVILDWDLYGDKGQKAVELVDGLIQQSVQDVPEQLRLILVYTQEQNLFDIANQLYEKINGSLGDNIEPLQEEGGLAFHTLNSRVSVLGKTGRARIEEYRSHEVEEKDLADRAVKEFSKLASGLLHAATLLGLAEIKKNSRKILSKFNSSLDPAFLTHRAMSLPDEDAANHLIPLLISEIEAVLEDSLPKPLVSEALIKDWCQTEWNPGIHVTRLLGDKVGPRELAVDFCLKGKNMRDKHKEVSLITQSITKKGDWNSSERSKIRDISSILLEKEDSTSNHEFSRLMSSRTFYDERKKDLKLGTIVCMECEEDNKYMLCLQPICDSVRITNPRKFLFTELEAVKQDRKNKASHVLILANNEKKELLYQPKSFKCYVSEFLPEARSKQVLAEHADDNQQIFEDTTGCKYIWIDQLKPAHAQRAAEKYARELSRVGLTESEWQRLLDT